MGWVSWVSWFVSSVGWFGCFVIWVGEFVVCGLVGWLAGQTKAKASKGHM